MTLDETPAHCPNCEALEDKLEYLRDVHRRALRGWAEETQRRQELEAKLARLQALLGPKLGDDVAGQH